MRIVGKELNCEQLLLVFLFCVVNALITVLLEICDILNGIGRSVAYFINQ